ncbi:Pilus assembly protein CpaE OS=Streptomyces violarus OX=67380 GN=FHS41_002548 PE=4 SV=1 [Streptomyces violarus]
MRKITGTAVAATTIPAHFKELQGVVDAGRVHELEGRTRSSRPCGAWPANSAWSRPPRGVHKAGRGRGDRGSVSFRRRRDGGG